MLQCDKPKKKTPPSSGPPPSMPPRQRASTLGVITEILDGSSKQGLPPSTSSGGNRNNRLNRSRNLSASSSNSSFHGSDSKNLSALPVVAGKLLSEVSCFFSDRFFFTEFCCHLQNSDGKKFRLNSTQFISGWQKHPSFQN